MKTPLAIVLSVVLAAGVVAANQLGAQTTGPAPTSAPTPTGTPVSASIATVQSIVEITRAVPAGTAAIDAFTVPAGVTLVITDVVVTNTGTAAVCGGAVNRAGGAGAAAAPTATAPTIAQPTASAPPPTAPATPASDAAPATTTSAGTLTQTDSTVTGPLCVPAQTTTTLPLTTGIEFGSGQVVQLLNAPAPAGAPAPPAVPGSLGFHLRGVLITLG